MKRGTFKKPTLEQVIAYRNKPRKALKRSKIPLDSSKKKNVVKRTKKVKEHWKPPAWFMVIPPGSHGSNPIQKRLWKLTSDFVRIRDWETWGTCVSSGKRIEHWKDGDCGHWKPWAVCNAYFKFHTINLSLQGKNDNRGNGGEVGYKFAEEMKRRYGDNILEVIEEENQAHQGQKFDNVKLVMMAHSLVVAMSKLSDKPDYYGEMMERFI